MVFVIILINLKFVKWILNFKCPRLGLWGGVLAKTWVGAWPLGACACGGVGTYDGVLAY